MCLSYSIKHAWMKDWFPTTHTHTLTLTLTHSYTYICFIPWLVNLASLVCDMGYWLSGKVSALHSVVAGSISTGGGQGKRCWWDLIRLKQLSRVPYVAFSACRTFSSWELDYIYIYIYDKLSNLKSKARGALLEKQEWTHEWRSFTDPYSLSSPCWPTSKNLFTSALCRRRM